MSGQPIRTFQTVNQLNEELYSELLGNVRSFLDKFFAIREVKVSIGEDRPQDRAKAMPVESFGLSGGDWLTIENWSDAVVKIEFKKPEVFGMTKAFIGTGRIATFRVDESIEKTMALVVKPDRITPQFITIGPPTELDD